MPKFQLKVSSQFDFLKQGGILVQNPLLQRSLKSMTFTWDLRRIIPSTADRLAVATTGLPALPDSTQEESKASKLCVVISGKSKSFISVPDNSNINVCRQLVKVLDSGDAYAAACISTKSGSIGTPVAKDDAALDSNKPVINCGW
jgi:hypothetical protein